MFPLRCTSLSDIGAVLMWCIGPLGIGIERCVGLSTFAVLWFVAWLSGTGIWWVHWRCIRHWDTSWCIGTRGLFPKCFFDFSYLAQLTLEPFNVLFFFFLLPFSVRETFSSFSRRFIAFTLQCFGHMDIGGALVRCISRMDVSSELVLL